MLLDFLPISKKALKNKKNGRWHFTSEWYVIEGHERKRKRWLQLLYITCEWSFHLRWFRVSYRQKKLCWKQKYSSSVFETWILQSCQLLDICDRAFSNHKMILQIIPKIIDFFFKLINIWLQTCKFILNKTSQSLTFQSSRRNHKSLSHHGFPFCRHMVLSTRAAFTSPLPKWNKIIYPPKSNDLFSKLIFRDFSFVFFTSPISSPSQVHIQCHLEIIKQKIFLFLLFFRFVRAFVCN